MTLANVHNLNQSHIKSCASPGEPRDTQGGREGQNAQAQPCYQVSYNCTLLQRNDNKLATAVPTMLSIQEKKRKEKFTLFSDHNGSLLRRQPGAMTIGHSPKGKGQSST